jgi:hypothetical protein
MVINKLTSSDNGLPEVWVANGALGYQIDSATKQLFQRFGETEIIVCIFAGGLFLKGYKEIEIAPLGIEAPFRSGTKEIKPFHSKTSADIR